MSPAALYLVSGDSLYPGATLLLVAIVWPWSPVRRLLILRNLTAWLGIALIIVGCPSISSWILLVFLAALFMWLIAKNQVRAGSPVKELRVVATCILLVCLFAVPVSEFFHRLMPRISGRASDHLVVIGDSLSSGIDGRTPTWPICFQHQAGISVRNLSRPGAGVAEARSMASQVKPQELSF